MQNPEFFKNSGFLFFGDETIRAYAGLAFRLVSFHACLTFHDIHFDLNAIAVI